MHLNGKLKYISNLCVTSKRAKYDENIIECTLFSSALLDLNHVFEFKPSLFCKIYMN